MCMFAGCKYICLQNHWCKSVFAAELIFRFPYRPGGIHTCTINTVKNFSKMFLLYFFRPCLPFRGRTVQLLKAASLIALDWSISVYGSSWNSLFSSFCLRDDNKLKEKAKERQWRRKRDTYCTWTAVYRNGKIRDY